MEENRYYVYLHKDVEGNVVYVGHGCGNRYLQASGREKEHKDVFDLLSKIVYEDGLSKIDAISIEHSLIQQYKETGKLLNKKLFSKPVKEVSYNYMDKFFYIDSTSPSHLRWKVSITSGNGKCQVKVGDVAGTPTKGGYWDLHIQKRCFKVHRVVWCLSNKKDTPVGLVVDHINRDRSDNSPFNLRLATPSQNASNGPVRSNNKTGATGVHFNINRHGRLVVTTTWRDQGVNKSKHFYPHNLFKDQDPEISKWLVVDIAREFREMILRSQGEVVHNVCNYNSKETC